MKFPPTHTTRYTRIDESDLADVDLVIAACHATEDRGQLALWGHIAASAPNRVGWLSPLSRDSAQLHYDGGESVLGLNDGAEVERLLRGKRVLIDISGLDHATWAPFFRASHALRLQTKVLYAEPERYREHKNPISSSRFDLSATLEGLAPLPGFARLSGPPDEEKCLFVSMLGFEGNRPECLAIQIEPRPKVVPVVGVPGFQVEYPAFTVACNRHFLEEYRANSEIRFARASCPFEAFAVLESIHIDYPDHYLYIAPVGTKPHALGSIWYALRHPDRCEILFDHPVRTPGRTAGVGVMHLYDFGSFSGG